MLETLLCLHSLSDPPECIYKKALLNIGFAALITAIMRFPGKNSSFSLFCGNLLAFLKKMYNAEKWNFFPSMKGFSDRTKKEVREREREMEVSNDVSLPPRSHFDKGRRRKKKRRRGLRFVPLPASQRGETPPPPKAPGNFQATKPGRAVVVV